MPSEHNAFSCLNPLGFRGGHDTNRVTPSDIIFMDGADSSSTAASIKSLAYRRCNSIK